MRILFDSRNTDFKTPFGPVTQRQDCHLSVHIPKECKTAGVKLRLFDCNIKPVTEIEMFPSGAYGGYEIYSCRFSESECGLYFYNFFIFTENESFELFRVNRGLTNIGEGELWQLSVLPEDYHIPPFYAGKIMYQIFPDRFNKKGEVSLEGKIEPYTVHKSVHETPVYDPEAAPTDKNNDFYGGNLCGIEEKLPYLRDLGVSVIYLNPIFKAHSNHRYDTADYLKVDEMLGTDRDFESLCRAAHTLGMKVIIDGVFSHTGSESVYFDIFGKYGEGAYNNPASPYRSWYQFNDSDVGYNCWWGIPTLPCTEELDPGFQSFILDRVLPKWLGLGADGIRLDVADELPDSFIKKLRDRAKSINPDVFIIGEVWEDASNKISYSERRKYFTGAELDSVMNYPFRNAVTGFVNGDLSAEGFADTVMTIAENYPSEVLLSLMNMLSTHDTPRILTLLGADGTREGCNTAYSKLKAAVAMQFILPGMPCVYYGDEIGMEGGKDPNNRRYFDWDKADCGFKNDSSDSDVKNPDSESTTERIQAKSSQKPGIPDIYRKMSELHRSYGILQLGSFGCYTPAPELIVLVREYKGQFIRAAFAGRDGADYTHFGNLLYSDGYAAGHLSPLGFSICISDK